MAAPSCAEPVTSVELLDRVLADLVDLRRQAAVLAGRVFDAVLAVDRLSPAGVADLELALALAWTDTYTRDRLALARFLRDVLPEVFTALRGGDLDEYRCGIFHDVLGAAQPAVACAVAAQVLPGAAGLTGAQLRRRLRRLLLRADPAGAAERTRKTVTDRRIGVSDAGDGTADLWAAHLPAARALAAFERVDAIARGARHRGDPRSLEQLRADTLLDLLEGVTPADTAIARRGVVEIVVPWATATGAGDEPAELAGFGPIAADVVREILAGLAGRADIDWRYSLRDTDGRLLRHGPLRHQRPAPPAHPPSHSTSTRRGHRPSRSTSSTRRGHRPSTDRRNHNPTAPAQGHSPAAVAAHTDPATARDATDRD